MGVPFTNLLASCCTSPSFEFGAKFATPCMALGPMCHPMCWLLSCRLRCFSVPADRWQVILGEFPGRCMRCAHSATTWPLWLAAFCIGCSVMYCGVIPEGNDHRRPYGRIACLPRPRQPLACLALGSEFRVIPLDFPWQRGCCVWVELSMSG